MLKSPHERTADPEDAAIADLPAVERTLDALTRTGGLARRQDLYLTEFGYQTDPPDPISGVAPSLQARWLAESAYVAWRDPRVRNLTQYVWRDEPVGPPGHGPQALREVAERVLYADGRPKPALATFPLPLHADLGRGILWGMVRPGGVRTVTVTRRVHGTTGFRPWARSGPPPTARSSFRCPPPQARRSYRAAAR